MDIWGFLGTQVLLEKTTKASLPLDRRWLFGQKHTPNPLWMAVYQGLSLTHGFTMAKIFLFVKESPIANINL